MCNDDNLCLLHPTIKTNKELIYLLMPRWGLGNSCLYVLLLPLEAWDLELRHKTKLKTPDKKGFKIELSKYTFPFVNKLDFLYN